VNGGGEYTEATHLSDIDLDADSDDWQNDESSVGG
jgi:hypothetical protein